MFGDALGKAEVFYSLFTTATIMTILEVVAAYVLFFPETRQAIERQVARIPGSPEDLLKTQELALAEGREVIATARAREAELCTGIINMHSYLFATVLIFVLVIVSLLLRRNYMRERAAAGKPPDGYVSSPLLASLLTVSCLVPFQGLFYYISMYEWSYHDPFPILAPIVMKNCAGVTPRTLAESKGRVARAVEQDYASLAREEESASQQTTEAADAAARARREILNEPDLKKLRRAYPADATLPSLLDTPVPPPPRTQTRRAAPPPRFVQR